MEQTQHNTENGQGKRKESSSEKNWKFFLLISENKLKGKWIKGTKGQKKNPTVLQEIAPLILGSRSHHRTLEASM